MNSKQIKNFWGCTLVWQHWKLQCPWLKSWKRQVAFFIWNSIKNFSASCTYSKTTKVQYVEVFWKFNIHLPHFIAEEKIVFWPSGAKTKIIFPAKLIAISLRLKALDAVSSLWPFSMIPTLDHIIYKRSAVCLHYIDSMRPEWKLIKK